MTRALRTATWLLIVLTILQTVALASAPGATPDARERVTYFFENVCGACSPETDFVEEFRTLTGRPLSEYRYAYYNVYREADKAAFIAEMDRLKVPDDRRLLPMVVIGDAYYPGSAGMKTDLPQDFVEQAAGQTDSVIHYLYVPSCGECSRAKAVIESLGDTLTVRRGNYEFPSRLVVNAIDMTEHAGVARALFERYRVPEDKQTAPIIFVGDVYLAGAERIERSLLLHLQAAEGIGTPPIGETAQALPSVSVWSVLAAGFVGGLNPCSLSMLLFFLSLLMAQELSIWKLALPFIIGKLAAYLLLGGVLLAVFRAFNPPWLPMASKMLLTVAGLALAAANIWDFLAARSERYDRIRVQLPVGLRRANHSIIKSFLSRGGKLLPLITFALGFVVSAGEFLCTGQVFLATVLTMVHTGTLGGYALLLFGLYGLAFVSPPLLVTALLAKGREMMDVSEWIRARMPQIKLITALLFLVVVALAWVWM